MSTTRHRIEVPQSVDRSSDRLGRTLAEGGFEAPLAVMDVIGRGDYVAQLVLDRVEVADVAQVTEVTTRSRYQGRLKAIGLYN